MKFVRFDSLSEVKDGELFFVIYPNGVVVLCWYSRRGYFSPEVDYSYDIDHTLPEIPSIKCSSNLLVSKFNVEG